nr:MAG TPA: hypothetical protein [Bacteriophage sp.]
MKTLTPLSNPRPATAGFVLCVQNIKLNMHMALAKSAFKGLTI